MSIKFVPILRQWPSLKLVRILGVVLVLVASIVIFSKPTSKVQEKLPISSPVQKEVNPDEPPLKLKNIGVNLDYYNPETNKAGDFEFTKTRLEFNRLFMGFGFVIPADVASSNKEKSNPQPTFIVPLGTPVRSLVDGVVAAMPTLWSGDISIQVTTDGKMQKWIYETEHVRNPKVKVGDRVSAGQVIAEVDNFGNSAPSGFGATEIGILKGGQKPEHVCPFAYLDESIKEETLKKLTFLFKSWEEYTGDKTLYDEANPIPGCLTLDPIEG